MTFLRSSSVVDEIMFRTYSVDAIGAGTVGATYQLLDCSKVLWRAAPIAKKLCIKFLPHREDEFVP
jgi:hypothetical protein